MNNIYPVRGGRGGDSYLIVGDQKTALVDCGMAYSASNLIHNIKEILSNRPLDCVFLSHSHYDHIGAIPFLRVEWPELKVYGAEHDQSILKRHNALKAIRELSLQAAKVYSEGLIEDYNNDLMKIDNVISEGDRFDLGHSTIQVLETPGHTRCTLSFLINHEILFVSESCGVLSHSGKIYPGFLVSYSQAIESIKKCQALHPKFIYSPHYGLVDSHSIMNYWQNCIESAEKSRYFILHYAELGYNEEQILLEYEEVFRDEESRSEQPIDAFRINTRSMIKTVLNTHSP
ncbi:MBL fold metallo-hydrolase [Desulfitobacterium metallireducens]|uniref:Hydrolase n=1 Tax=Desulfitobacterium metallireducens DSM 15288 TaxID=871968 RepID=W0EBB6_9FIRM|nr:MBL fold metallo-hydrolase [Desulfitobacterium metallireducens]AHF06509.1 hydrolase [Desulfitobacterium metallireducens DSM 15288]